MNEVTKDKILLFLLIHTAITIILAYAIIAFQFMFALQGEKNTGNDPVSNILSMLITYGGLILPVIFLVGTIFAWIMYAGKRDTLAVIAAISPWTLLVLLFLFFAVLLLP